MNITFTPRHIATIGIAVSALSLGACSKSDDRTIGQKIDSTVATAKEKTRDATAESKDVADRTRNTIESKAKDAEITTRINAELARDKTLSALSINVDTSNGKVALKGTAPDAESRDRASQIANAVQGVVSVDNQLTVSPKS